MNDLKTPIIWSGGQTGVDRGALDAAIEAGRPYGGFCPKNRLAEDGMIPAKYRLVEKGLGYLERTLANVEGSDGSLIISSTPLRGGTLRTFEFTQSSNKPCLIIEFPLLSILDLDLEAKNVRFWLRQHRQIGILNVAGPCESEVLGIGELTKRLILKVLKG